MKRRISQSAIQVTGLLLWRTGLIVASATALYRTSKFLLQFIDLPIQIEVGIGFIFSGAVLFMASLIVERLADAKAEGELSQ